MPYINTHSRHRAFLANQLNRLADLITEQGDDMLVDAGLTLPSRSVSLLLLIDERGQISAADIAKELNQPHQLVTQRIEALIKLNLINRINDSADKRRKILTLTTKGQKELLQLDQCLQNAEHVFQALYQEIECDLSAITQLTIKTLSTHSILDRIVNINK